MSRNGVIGNSKIRAMPWYNREEMMFFKDQTMGKVVVMGRKTAEETGPLRGRDCLVLSKDPDYKLHGFKTLTIDAFLTLSEYNFNKHYMVCGGAEIYTALMPYASTAMISYMNFEVEGDVKMPDMPREQWIKAQTIEMKDFTAINYINNDRVAFAYPECKSVVTNKRRNKGI